MHQLKRGRIVIAHDRLMDQLRKIDGPDTTRLADLLQACGNSTPCHSAACPSCGIAFQKAAVGVVDELISEPARDIRSRMHALTIVPASGIVEPDDLSVEVFETVGVEVLAAFAELQLPPAIIGLEASFNEDFTERIPPHWCVHPHTIV